MCVLIVNSVPWLSRHTYLLGFNFDAMAQGNFFIFITDMIFLDILLYQALHGRQKYYFLLNGYVIVI